MMIANLDFVNDSELSNAVFNAVVTEMKSHATSQSERELIEEIAEQACINVIKLFEDLAYRAKTARDNGIRPE